MPVTLDVPDHNRYLRSARRAPMHKSQRRERCSPDELVIGLLNNMSDGALEATERQFISLLSAAAQGLRIRLSLYHFPEVMRGKSAQRRLARLYRGAETLANTRLDGLIVTGREPLSPSLRNECYWDSFVRVHEWARENTFSTVWSCLAAHAAVLHADGIQRQLSQYKVCGIYHCSTVTDHPLIRHISADFRLPHSRWNGLPEAELTRRGYQVLTRAQGAGVDCFIKQQSSLFVYFQGHPEYESDTLLREYCRDVNRYLNGESSAYPSIPCGYFHREAERELATIQSQADARPAAETLARIASVALPAAKVSGWSATARTLYGNWLAHLHASKRERAQSRDAAVCQPIVRSAPALAGAR